jgi:phenylacetate-coenzyme A ligase PaaK-like adenylate-forming protein
MNTNQEQVLTDKGDKVGRPSTLLVVVHYIAAGEPFKDPDASRTETVGALKQRVLDAFGLTEGQTPDGNTTTYTLHQSKTELTDPNQQLGELAGDKHELQLKLGQRVIQGRA